MNQKVVQSNRICESELLRLKSILADFGRHRIPDYKIATMNTSRAIGIVACGLFGLLTGCQRQTITSNVGQANSPSPQVVKAVEKFAKTERERFVAMRDAQATVPLVKEFLGIFPAAEVQPKYLTLSGVSGFEAIVSLHQRYELSMRLLVHFDYGTTSIVGYEEPRFTLHEVKSVTTNKTGRAELVFNPAAERSFGSNEWRKIVESHGDFGSIGYAMETNQPMAGFKDWKFPRGN